MDIWPNFFIIGAPRCGTTSLYEYLKKTKQIFMSHVKEPNYFSKATIPDNYIFAPVRNEKEYLKLFDGVTDEVAIGESTVHYLQDPIAPKLIHEKIPDCKFIISLRDPVERAYSHFLYYQSFGFEKRTFRKAIEDNIKNIDNISGKHYINGGLYFEQLQRYLEFFKKEQILIILFENLAKNTGHEITKIFDFLKVSEKLPKEIDTVFNQYSHTRSTLSDHILKSTFITKFSRKIIPEPLRIKLREDILTKKSTKPEMNESDRLFLQKFYSSSVNSLSEFLDMELPWKNFFP